MSNKKVQDDEPEYGQFSIQDLLKHSIRVDKNIAEVENLVAKHTAMEEFGLTEVAPAPKPAKKDNSALEAAQREVAELKAQLAAAQAAQVTPTPPIAAPAVPAVPTAPVAPVNPFADKS